MVSLFYAIGIHYPLLAHRVPKAEGMGHVLFKPMLSWKFRRSPQPLAMADLVVFGPLGNFSAAALPDEPPEALAELFPEFLLMVVMVRVCGGVEVWVGNERSGESRCCLLRGRLKRLSASTRD